MRIPTRKSEILKQTNRQDDNYVTAAALERMKRELERLTKTERGPAAEEVARTAQMGDLSENAAYQFAKQNLRRINDRITMLGEKIKHAIVIEKDNSGKIQIGSVVRVMSADKISTFEILGSLESNPFKGKISHLSPLGKTLLGHIVGDRVTLKNNSQETDYEIVEVS